MAHRYFTNNIVGNTAKITGDDANHLIKVLRVKIDDTLNLFDNFGMDYIVKITNISPSNIECLILSKTKNDTEPDINVTLYVGYPKSDKLEFIIQKAVELGAVKIVPFFSKYCVVTPKKEEQKNIRYNKIAYEAVKQSGRGIIPTVELPISFKEMINQQSNYDLSLFCYEAQDKDSSIPLNTLLNQSKNISIITGSEGGFDENEAELALQNTNVISLGKRILRCETAPIVALTSVMLLTDNL